MLSAYSGEDGKLVVVAINKGSAAVSVPISIAGGTASGSVTPWLTSTSENLAAQSALSVAGGSFTAALEGLSVTTFVSE